MFKSAWTGTTYFQELAEFLEEKIDPIISPDLDTKIFPDQKLNLDLDKIATNKNKIGGKLIEKFKWADAEFEESRTTAASSAKHLHFPDVAGRAPMLPG